MHSALQRYLRELDQVTQVVEGTPADRWDAPTPCPDWSARQLLGHLVDGQRQVVALATGNGPRPPVTDPAALGRLLGPDPRDGWRRAHADTTAALAQVPPGSLVPTPFGEQPVEQVVGLALIEPLVHGWDLAVATGQDVVLDPEAVAATLPTVLVLGDGLAATGMYRPARPAPGGASDAERLLAALGRDPRPAAAAGRPA